MEQSKNDRTAQDREGTARNAPQEHADNCRCKEVSTLSPGELLRVMLNDLAFWKKVKER